MNVAYFRSSCRELVQALCALVDQGEVLSRAKFHELCEKERFIEYLFDTYGDKLRMPHLEKTSTICDPAVLTYIENGFARHANVAVMEEFGLRNNVMLMAVNIAVAIQAEQDPERLEQGMRPR
ncbi:MAG TPA: hypothetical protein VHB46_04490 [Burkholderiales bacterium]|nr:hypothetical protein [Burkholderiales bacterium]